MNQGGSSSDPFRLEHRELSPQERQQVDQIKQSGQQLYQQFSQIGESREASIAKTKLEEAVMWGTKAATRSSSGSSRT